MLFELTNDSLPRFSTPFSRSQETFVLTVTLLSGLIIFAPVFEALVSVANVPVPQPLLVGVAIAWAAYGLLIIAIRRLPDGLFIGFLVAATFSADVPLTSGAALFPGHTVGTVVMYYGPLVGLSGVAVALRWYQSQIPVSVYFLAAFVGATVLSAVFGGGPSATVGLWFSGFALIGLLSYLMTILAVQNTRLSLSEALGVFFIVVCAQALVGLVQLVRGQPFGLWELGEASRQIVATLSFPLVGRFLLGTHVSGFTGMAFQLAFLLVLACPLVIALYQRASGWVRLLPVGCLLIFVLLVRGSSSDAARGALIGSLLTFVVLWLIVCLPKTLTSQPVAGEVISKLFEKLIVGGSVIALLLYPSSAAGQISSQQVTSKPSTSPTSGSGSAASSESAGLQNQWLLEQVESISSLAIPFFDLSNLGTRLNQYLAAVDVFLQYPLFGLGGMNFVLVGEQYGVPSPSYTELTYPIHSIYFTLLAETGILGLTLFGLTVGLIFVYGYQAAKSPETDAVVPLALLAGLSGALAYMLLDVFLLTNAASWAQFWIVAGFVTAAYQQIQPGAN